MTISIRSMTTQRASTLTEVSTRKSPVTSSVIQVRAALAGLLLSSALGNIIPALGGMLVVVLFSIYGEATNDIDSEIEAFSK